MLRLTFGSGNTRAVPPTLWRLGLAALGATGALIVTGCVLTIWYAVAHAGCTTIPSVTQLVRRDAVCAQLGLKSMCFLQPQKLVAGVLFSGEQHWDLVLDGVHVGTFPFPPGSLPVDPARCTDREYVQDLLRFHTGSRELQALLRTRFPHDIGAGDVVYFDTLLGVPDASPGLCVISAQLMVVRAA